MSTTDEIEEARRNPRKHLQEKFDDDRDVLEALATSDLPLSDRAREILEAMGQEVD